MRRRSILLATLRETKVRMVTRACSLKKKAGPVSVEQQCGERSHASPAPALNCAEKHTEVNISYRRLNVNEVMMIFPCSSGHTLKVLYYIEEVSEPYYTFVLLYNGTSSACTRC
jgi:hypothetical protein